MELLIGLLAGILVGATGIGSGSLIAPVLVLGGYTPATAVGTGLVAMICSKLTAAELHRRLGNWPPRHTITITLGGLSGVASTWAGSSSSLCTGALHLHGESYWKFVLAAALLLAAVALQFSRQDTGIHRGLYFNCENRPVILYLIGASVAVVVTLTSAGSGGLLIPLLLWVTPWKPQELASTSNVFGTVVGLAGIAFYAHEHVQDLRLTLIVLTGVVPGVFVGVRFAGLISREMFARGVGVLTASIAGALLFRTLTK